VRRIRLQSPLSNLQKLIMAMGDAFQILEYPYIGPPAKDDARLVLPPSTRNVSSTTTTTPSIG
jgi:hypothetical protein